MPASPLHAFRGIRHRKCKPSRTRLLTLLSQLTAVAQRRQLSPGSHRFGLIAQWNLPTPPTHAQSQHHSPLRTRACVLPQTTTTTMISQFVSFRFVLSRFVSFRLCGFFRFLQHRRELSGPTMVPTKNILHCLHSTTFLLLFPSTPSTSPSPLSLLSLYTSSPFVNSLSKFWKFPALINGDFGDMCCCCCC